MGLSKPLIPEFQVLDGVTVGQMIKKQTDRNPFLVSWLETQGYTKAQAEKEEERVMKGVRPAIHFITDQANVWSVKPVVMFDWARTSAVTGTGSGNSWTGAGGGVRLGIVTAQLQAAYIHSVGSGPSSGNFVFRLTFQNLF